LVSRNFSCKTGLAVLLTVAEVLMISGDGSSPWEGAAVGTNNNQPRERSRGQQVIQLWFFSNNIWACMHDNYEQ
jgi:hypothetical protein